MEVTGKGATVVTHGWPRSVAPCWEFLCQASKMQAEWGVGTEEWGVWMCIRVLGLL